MGDDAWMMMGGSGWMMDRQPVDDDRWMVMDRWRDGRMMDGWIAVFSPLLARNMHKKKHNAFMYVCRCVCVHVCMHVGFFVCMYVCR
jgi:hypothetical protein